MRSSMHFLGGSVAVYVLMAACSGGGKGGDGAASAGMSTLGGAATNNGGALATSGGAATGGAMNGMMNPVPEANAETKSGTRLKARHYVGADGSKQFVGWRDTMRNEDCTFSKADDGMIRCIPSASYSSDFADAGCSQPLGSGYTNTGTACPGQTVVTPTYFAALSCSGYKYYKTGAAVTTPAMVYIGAPGACIGRAPQAGYTYYALTPIAASEFAAATEQIE